MTTMIRPIVWLLGLTVVAAGPAIAQRRGGAPGPPPTPQASAAIDLTGQWVAIISEDWRHRMMPPRKGDLESVPLNAEGRKVASGWDLAAERAAGEPCRAYGAPGVMRIPGRLRISWENATTLRIDLDAGIQTRRFFFGSAPTMAPSWQGTSVASWNTPAVRHRVVAAPGRRIAQGRHHRHPPWLAAQERRSLQRQRAGHRTLQCSHRAQRRSVPDHHDNRRGPAGT